MHTYAPENSVFDGLITNLLSILCILVEVISRAYAKEVKSLNGFKFGTFIGRFPSDGAAGMTVKGLRRSEYSALIPRQVSSFPALPKGASWVPQGNME